MSARAAGDHTTIDGRRGRIEAPADIVSNHPWNYAVLERTLLFDTQRGRLQQVQVSTAGTETITVAGHAIAAHKYVVTETTTPALLSITTVLSNWKTDAALDDAQFKFMPPKGTTAIRFLPRQPAGPSNP